MFIKQKTKPNTISISHDVRVRNMTGVTSTAATDYPSGAPGYTPVAHSIVSSVVIDIFEGLSFCSVFCLPLHSLSSFELWFWHLWFYHNGLTHYT
jgi:hypothetical protein